MKTEQIAEVVQKLERGEKVDASSISLLPLLRELLVGREMCFNMTDTIASLQKALEDHQRWGSASQVDNDIHLRMEITRRNVGRFVQTACVAGDTYDFTEHGPSILQETGQNLALDLIHYFAKK